MFGNETTAYAMKIIHSVLKMGHGYSPEILSDAGVPDAYGKSILTKLARNGLVLSRKGRGAGCGFRMNPEKLSTPLSEIFSLFSPPRLILGDTGSAGRILDGLLKGLETRTANLTLGDLA